MWNTLCTKCCNNSCFTYNSSNTTKRRLSNSTRPGSLPPNRNMTLHLITYNIKYKYINLYILLYCFYRLICGISKHLLDDVSLSLIVAVKEMLISSNRLKNVKEFATRILIQMVNKKRNLLLFLKKHNKT